MRLSALVTLAILFLSAALVAQHSTAGGGSTSSGGYSGGYSGGASSGSSHSGGSSSSGSYSGTSSSHASSAGSSGGTHNSGSVSSSGGRADRGKTGSNAVRSSDKNGGKETARLSTAKPEKKGVFSFLRHRKPEPKLAAFVPPIRCRRGENCRICRGARSGACIVETSCAGGLVWNGISCGPQYAWWSDCSAIASQLAAMRRQGLGNPGQNLMYAILLQQYQGCLARVGAASFSSYSSLFDLP
jgi:hypothetical protein